MNTIVNASSKRNETLAKLKGDAKKSARSYLSEIKDELKKVSWPLKDELLTCTKVVIGATFVLGLGIYGADLVIKGVLDGIGSIARLVG